MSKPPVRALPRRLEAQRFLARARQFKSVALPLHDMDGPEPNWPKWFMVMHAIELALKAFNISREDSAVPAPAVPEPSNHDLVGLYDYAVMYGLPRDSLVTKELPHLSDLHQSAYARYPKDEAKSVALIAQFDDMVDRLIADITRVVMAR